MTNNNTTNPEDKLFYKVTSKIEFYFVGNLFFALSAAPFLLTISSFSLRLDTLIMYLVGFISLSFSFSALLMYGRQQETSIKIYFTLLRNSMKRSLPLGVCSFLAFFSCSIVLEQFHETPVVYFMPGLIVVIAMGLGYVYVNTVTPQSTAIWKRSVIVGVLYVFMVASLIYVTKIAIFMVPMFCALLLSKWEEENK